MAACYQRQVTSIHVVAYYLTPTNFDKALDGPVAERFYEFICQYSKSSEEAREIRREYIKFRLQDGVFHQKAWCWESRNNPLEFWEFAKGCGSRFLAQFAIRVFSTPANSVPCERAFSAQNHIHTKECNALDPERVNKLTYVYMNYRVLKKGARSPFSMSEEEEVELEDAILNHTGAEVQALLEFENLNGDGDGNEERNQRINLLYQEN